MDSSELTCQLCHQTGLKKFEIEGSNSFWLCESCELYQYGQLVDHSAYSSDYHSGYDRHRNKKIRTARIRLNRVEPLLNNNSGGPISMLDVGCSVGATLEAARFFDWAAVGVDVSRDAVEYCQQQGLQAQAIDGTNLPFEDNSFDLVVNWHVIEHVQDVRATLREWGRVLKPGGVLFLETPDASSPKVRKLGTSYRKFWAPEHTYTFTYDNLSRFMTESGLEVVSGPWIGKLSNLGPASAFALGYRVFHGLRRAVGVHKEFQIFARKPASQKVGELDAAPAAA